VPRSLLLQDDDGFLDGRLTKSRLSGEKILARSPNGEIVITLSEIQYFEHSVIPL
jgi:hypothetical protein